MAEARTWSDDRFKQEYMRERAAVIYYWKWLYYKSTPAVDDQTFDLHWNNLLHLEATYPHLVDYESPTEMVGAPQYRTYEQLKMGIYEVFGYDFLKALSRGVQVLE